MCGSQSHGQSQATTYAQIVADQIGCDIGDVEVVFGDTDRIPFGQGTYGSRSLTVTGSALYLATGRVVEKSRKIASALPECDFADVEISHERLIVVGHDRSVSFKEVKPVAYFGSGQE